MFQIRPLCNDVLANALEMLVSGLPPLALADEGKIPEVGKTSLKQVNSMH